jgi:hypothetical protein
MAGVPGYQTLAGQLLNVILADLCQTYNLDLARKVTIVSLSAGAGPYPLPADYLRADYGDVFYTINGQPYVLVNVDLSEYDALAQPQGNASYPEFYATDLSGQNPTPLLYCWPPSSGPYPLTIRYRAQLPDISTPETSSVVPWFPNTNYLVTRLAGELMKVADDSRSSEFLGDSPSGAQGILDRYLKLKDDSSSRPARIKLDRRSFGSNFSRLKPTKSLVF